MKKLTRTLATIAGLALLGPLSATFAQNTGSPADDQFTGLKVGTKVPDFTLKDQEGNDRTLAEMLKKGKVALVFYRSADW